MSGLSTKIPFWIKIFIFGLSRPYILIYVIMWRFHGAWIRSGLLMRKICHGLSLYVILSKVIFYQFLEEVQATKIRSSNPRSHIPKILHGYLLKIFILSNSYPRCWSQISWRKEFSWLSKSKLFFWEILIFCGQYSLNGYPTLLSLVQVSQASLLSLKGLEHQMGYFNCPVKTELFDCGNRMVQFLCF
jgi:hypothetical protein